MRITISKHTTCYILEINWAYQGTGECRHGSWIKIGNPNTLEEATLLMEAHQSCFDYGSMLFYSHSYSGSSGAYCATRDMLHNCNEPSSHMTKYLLSKGKS